MIDWQNWALMQPLPAVGRYDVGMTRVILAGFAYWADDDGVAWVSSRKIAERYRLNRRHVQDAIAALVDAKWLLPVAVGAGRRANGYRLNLDHPEAVVAPVVAPVVATFADQNPHPVDNPLRARSGTPGRTNSSHYAAVVATAGARSTGPERKGRDIRARDDRPSRVVANAQSNGYPPRLTPGRHPADPAGDECEHGAPSGRCGLCRSLADESLGP